MKSTKVQTLGTLYRNVEPIHKCGTTTIDGLDHASKRTACYALFPWIIFKMASLRAKKYIRLIANLSSLY
jgi:hypothetical protein